MSSSSLLVIVRSLFIDCDHGRELIIIVSDRKIIVHCSWLWDHESCCWTCGCRGGTHHAVLLFEKFRPCTFLSGAFQERVLQRSCPLEAWVIFPCFVISVPQWSHDQFKQSGMILWSPDLTIMHFYTTLIMISRSLLLEHICTYIYYIRARISYIHYSMLISIYIGMYICVCLFECTSIYLCFFSFFRCNS